MSRKKTLPTSTTFQKQLRQWADEYAAETGETKVSTYQIATWAISTGRYIPPAVDERRRLAKDIATAMRQDYFIDEDTDQPVRRRHAYRVLECEKQQVFWVNIEDATREQMRLAAQLRRKGILGDVTQLSRDVNYYNREINPGEQLLIDWDFTKDVQETLEPQEYEDTPPEEDPNGVI